MYEGYYKDGTASGHGLRKSGSFKTNDATVYVGEWVSGLRQGYGVMDDIFTGIHFDNRLYPTQNWFFTFGYDQRKIVLRFELDCFKNGSLEMRMFVLDEVYCVGL